MTAIPPVPDPQTARPSKAIVAVAHTESILNLIIAKVIGVALMGAGGFLAYLEAVKPEPRTAQLALVVGVAVLGAALVATDPMVNAIKSVGGAVAPYLPKWKGGS